MQSPPTAVSLLGSKRPVLRVQLALLYSGLFVGLSAVVLVAISVLFGTTNVLFGHSQTQAPSGATAAPHIVNGRHFDLGPALIVLAAVAIALVLAWWLAGKFLRPLRTMTAAAKEISVTNLHRRLDLDGPDDELTELGRTLNDLFGRLEASFESQRHFVANASHELRTPLTGLRSVLEVALADPDPNLDSYRTVCREALALSEHQERLIDALLALATSERGIEQWELFDLDRITEPVLATRADEAARQGIHIEPALAPARATGDPKLVELLIANLVDNALRHNIPGGHIDITTSTAQGRSIVTVGNTGPTVPSDEIQRLFQPFQQAGSPRIGHNNGHGLGLAIVGAISKAHNAEITAHPRPSGGLDIAVAFESLGRNPSIPSNP